MAQTKKIDSGELDLVAMAHTRQLLLLNSVTGSIQLPTNITAWEEVTCAGYNPYQQRLEAVVSVKRATGYSGGLCTNSSREYVRFFVDFKDGAGFRDMGYTSFKVADISDAPAGSQHPLSYTAFLYFDDQKYRRFLDCDKAVLPTVRAVLSWNNIPATNPDQAPHYGNHIDADIQLARKQWIWWKDILKLMNLKDILPVYPEYKVELKAPVGPEVESLFKSYTETKVSSHRTFFSTIGSKLSTSLDFSKAAGILDVSNIDNYGIKIDGLNEYYNNPKDGDTTYEELTCIGLNTLTDRLGAIIHIKKPTGYIGNLCTNGSYEHVAFWADWNNNGTFDQYLGTVSVNVHDIANITSKGLYYNVELPIDVTKRLRACSNPNIVRIRAVLSWESLPSTTSSAIPPHWGNHKDALVQIRPLFRAGTGSIYSALYYVGGADRAHVDQLSGPHLYSSPSLPAESNNRPWGGAITFQGVIDRTGYNGVIKYRILVKKYQVGDTGAPDSAFQPVSTSETFTLDNIFNLAGPYPEHQSDPNGWYIYSENYSTGIINVNHYLATWNAGTAADGVYSIRFEHTDELGNTVIADQFAITVCNKGMSISPTANTSVDTAYDMDLVIDGGDCHSYTPGEPTINGHLRAVHPYFSRWSLALEPSSHAHATAPVPATRAAISVSDNGDPNAAWTLDTKKLDPCGYTVSLWAHTRVILNSDLNLPYYAPKAVGFAKLP